MPGWSRSRCPPTPAPPPNPPAGTMARITSGLCALSDLLLCALPSALCALPSAAGLTSAVRRRCQTRTQLVVLSSEPGDNLENTSYNGLPFDVGAKWLVAVPELGIFCAKFVTPPGCASLTLRLGLARRTLMPGHGRWKAIPKQYRDPDEDPYECEASLGMECMMIGADGGLVEDYRRQADRPSAVALMGAMRVKFKLKSLIERRRALGTVKVAAARQVNHITAAPLGDIVALTLRAARSKKEQDAQAMKEKEQGKEGGAEGPLQKDTALLEIVTGMVEGEGVPVDEQAAPSSRGRGLAGEACATR